MTGWLAERGAVGPGTLLVHTGERDAAAAAAKPRPREDVQREQQEDEDCREEDRAVFQPDRLRQRPRQPVDALPRRQAVSPRHRQLPVGRRRPDTAHASQGTRCTHKHTHTHTHTCLTAVCPGLPGSAGTRKVKPVWISLKQETVSGSGISRAVGKACRPTNSIKAL